MNKIPDCRKPLTSAEKRAIRVIQANPGLDGVTLKTQFKIGVSLRKLSICGYIHYNSGWYVKEIS